MSVVVALLNPSRFFGSGGFGFSSSGKSPQLQLPNTGNFIVDLLLLIVIPYLNAFSALFNNAIGVVLNTFPLMHLISVLTSLVDLAAMYVDKQVAQFERWRLSERAMEWHAVAGGGPGILAGAFTFRHKTRHGILLAKVIVATV